MRFGERNIVVVSVKSSNAAANWNLTGGNGVSIPNLTVTSHYVVLTWQLHSQGFTCHKAERTQLAVWLATWAVRLCPFHTARRYRRRAVWIESATVCMNLTLTLTPNPLSKSVKRFLRYYDFPIFEHGIFGSLLFNTIQNLVVIDNSSFDNTKVWIFGAFGLKTPVHAPKVGVWGILTPRMGSNINETPNGTFLHEFALFEPSSAKIQRPVWPVGEFRKRV